MKIDNLQQAPSIIQYIWAASAAGQPIGSSTYEKARKEYPEYFEDEFEFERKWTEVPQQVKDAYYKELYGWNDEDITPSKGLLDLLKEAEPQVIEPLKPEEILPALEDMWKVRERRETEKKEAEKRKEQLFNKYFSEYGLEYNE